MALDVSKLGSALADVFANMPTSKDEAAKQIAQAYYDYASGGLFGASVPTLSSSQRDAMAGTITLGLTVPGLPMTIAAAFAAALTVFWIAVPVAGPQVGATAGCPGAASLIGSLPAVFLNLANTPETCGVGVAAALHTATMTVTASVAPPPGTVLPIS